MTIPLTRVSNVMHTPLHVYSCGNRNGDDWTGLIRLSAQSLLFFFLRQINLSTPVKLANAVETNVMCSGGPEFGKKPSLTFQISNSNIKYVFRWSRIWKGNPVRDDPWEVQIHPPVIRRPAQR